MNDVIVDEVLFGVLAGIVSIVTVVKCYHDGNKAKGNEKDKDEGTDHEGPVGAHVFRLGWDADASKAGSGGALNIGVLILAFLILWDNSYDHHLAWLEWILEYIDPGLLEDKAEPCDKGAALEDGILKSKELAIIKLYVGVQDWIFHVYGVLLVGRACSEEDGWSLLDTHHRVRDLALTLSQPNGIFGSPVVLSRSAFR